jgi:hypothetical protein
MEGEVLEVVPGSGAATGMIGCEEVEEMSITS